MQTQFWVLSSVLKFLSNSSANPAGKSGSPSQTRMGPCGAPLSPPAGAQCCCQSWGVGKMQSEEKATRFPLLKGCLPWDPSGPVEEGPYMRAGRAGKAAQLCPGWREVAHLPGQGVPTGSTSVAEKYSTNLAGWGTQIRPNSNNPHFPNCINPWPWISS